MYKISENYSEIQIRNAIRIFRQKKLQRRKKKSRRKIFANIQCPHAEIAREVMCSFQRYRKIIIYYGCDQNECPLL